MDCPTVREHLLGADLDALEASPIAAHLATCAPCAARAAVIRRATARLAADLAVPAAAPARLGWRRPATLVALAAAAALALLLRGPGHEAPPPAEIPVPSISVPEGTNAVVFRTSNPQITIVWYY